MGQEAVVVFMKEEKTTLRHSIFTLFHASPQLKLPAILNYPYNQLKINSSEIVFI